MHYLQGQQIWAVVLEEQAIQHPSVAVYGRSASSAEVVTSV